MRWAAQAPTNKAVVVYDTMWESTDLMARVIADGLADALPVPTARRAAFADACVLLAFAA